MFQGTVVYLFILHFPPFHLPETLHRSSISRWETKTKDVQWTRGGNWQTKVRLLFQVFKNIHNYWWRTFCKNVVVNFVISKLRQTNDFSFQIKFSILIVCTVLENYFTQTIDDVHIGTLVLKEKSDSNKKSAVKRLCFDQKGHKLLILFFVNKYWCWWDAVRCKPTHQH